MADNTVEDENEGTILTFDDAENVSVEDIMYLLQGTGSSRDRKISLGALMTFLVANQKFTELKLVKDSEHDISIKWDETNGEFVIWERANNGTVAVPKLHVHGALRVEKDTTLDGNVTMTKTLDVTDTLTANGASILKGGLESKARAKFERINVGNAKCFFEISADSNINTLLSNSGIATQEGDIVTLYNNSVAYHTVTLGQRTGLGTMTTTIDALCAMSFICVYADQTYEWAPIGNTTVTCA